ncbi:isoprenoid synthase domain-containing protein [Chaetomium strumarium]|uniref:Isoprenoid synthase domain-containing protein n=1 Tax=Chaetomium strumarium TaxID=1170767 RepID=A0AAJ0GXB5_9PEZI|nr:isoprenoid synthase domain-containing protein [Chaetomium strumarium]
MEFPNSRLIETSEYPAYMDGLSTFIPVRVHRDASLADRGALRAQKDWQRVLGPLPPGFSGTMGPAFNFVAVTMPETLPDRFELVGYIVEMMFLINDRIDMAAESSLTELAAPHLADVLHARELVMNGGGGEVDDVSSCSPATKLMASVGREMFAVDPEAAVHAVRWLEKWVKLMMGMGRAKAGHPKSLDEYLEGRLVDVTSHINGAAIGLKLFAMGLRIPEDQQQMCLDLSRPFWLQTLLVNDYHSLAREVKQADLQGKTKSVWREKTREYCAEYLRVLEGVRARDDLCKDAKFLLETLQFGMSGNIVWSQQCPRYHDNQTLTPAQLEMARGISADEATGPSLACPGQQGGEKVLLSSLSSLSLHQTDNTPSLAQSLTYQIMAVVQSVPPLGTEALEAPTRYLDSLPAKGIRDKVIDALNFWFRVPAEETAIIKKTVNLLHGASLMMDDIQDSSQLRRGSPATHLVFGQMQTINSAGYRFLLALEEIRKLKKEIRDLYIGQSHDLEWTNNLACPTVEEYLAMVDGKTSGLFRMLARMLDAKSTSPTKLDVVQLTRFMTLLGRLFQVRDDYMNLTSADYTKQKGFCEDLDEGKYSLPLIHALSRAGLPSGSTVLQNLLAQRHVQGRMSLAQKKLVLQQLQQQGSLAHTQRAVHALQAVLRDMAEKMNMMENEELKRLLEGLKV